MIASMTTAAAAPSKPERPVPSPAQIEKIATGIVTAGLVAIVIKPFRDDLRVTIETKVAKQPPEAKTLWLLSTKAAERVLGEVADIAKGVKHRDRSSCTHACGCIAKAVFVASALRATTLVTSSCEASLARCGSSRTARASD
jgi:hypothetical protein